MEPAARDAFLDDMERFVVEHFGGVVTRPIVVTLTTAGAPLRSTQPWGRRALKAGGGSPAT